MMMEMKDLALLLLLLLLPFCLRLPYYLSHVLDNSGSNGSRDREDNRVSSENEGVQTNLGTSELGNGRRIGSLFISMVEIGRGSSGTTVFKGTHGKRDGKKRSVAVKRLVKGHHHLADTEIQHFILSDGPPNILRYYAEESDQDFVYLALELCDFSLDDLIQVYSDSSNKSDNIPQEYEIKLNSVRDAMQDGELLRADGCPSPLLLELMRGIVLGLVHLHRLGLIHRALNPRNVLITRHPSLCAKLSDMGISKLLPPGKSSMGYPASSSGMRGWQAPEQLQKGSQTCKMDMFNLGCVLFFCLTRGSHPFGRDIARDVNIEENKMDLSLVEFIPEAHDLISRLLNPQSELRPKALEVCCHPFFWNSEKRLSFFRALSNRVKLEKNPASSNLLKALENTAQVVFSKRLQKTAQVFYSERWTDEIETNVMGYLNKYRPRKRPYNGYYVKDLLRAVRNVVSHLEEFPNEVQFWQDNVGSVRERVEAYFAKRFPSLLMESYKVALQFCEKEEVFQEYFL